MGWMWASKMASATASPARSPPSSSAAQPSPAAAAAQPPAAAFTDTDISDPEVAKFLAFFQEQPDSKPQPPAAPTIPVARKAGQESAQGLSFSFPGKPKSVSSPSSSDPSLSEVTSHPSSNSKRHSSPWPQGRYANTFNDDSVEDLSKPPPSYSTLPTSMSCRNAFDYAYHCTSFGGQWNAVYRDGNMRHCSEQWADFWFCMRTRQFTGTAKDRAYQEYYRDKERNKYDGQPNSEDIWAARKHLVRDNTFLVHPMPAPRMSDQEWNEAEIKKRKEIRRQLGLGPEAATHEWGVRKDS